MKAQHKYCTLLSLTFIFSFYLIIHRFGVRLIHQRIVIPKHTYIDTKRTNNEISKAKQVRLNVNISWHKQEKTFVVTHHIHDGLLRYTRINTNVFPNNNMPKHQIKGLSNGDFI